MYRRPLRSLAPSWLRALTLSSFAMGGLLVAAPAHADEAREVPATILDVSMVDGELTARIRWSAEAKSLPEEVEVLSYDGKDSITAGERLAPKAGEVSEVKLSGAVQEPWETGWAQRLVVRAAKGRELASQPYDVSLACEDEKSCELKAAPGVSASREVVHLSTRLRDTLAVVEKEQGAKGFDLVREVARRDPSLLGEAMTYAQGLVRVTPAEGCNCTWDTTFERSNSAGTALGAALNAHALSLGHVASNRRVSVQGTSRVTLTLRCATLSTSLQQSVGIKQPGGLVKSVLLPKPVYSTCAGKCSGLFNHFGRITGLATAYDTGSAAPLLNGTAMVQGRYHLGNAQLPLLNELRYAPANQFFDVRTYPTNMGGGTGWVQTAGEGFYAFNGSDDPRPFGRAQSGYAIAVQGNAVCPGGVLNPIGRVWDTESTHELPQGEESLTDSIWRFFGFL